MWAELASATGSVGGNVAGMLFQGLADRKQNRLIYENVKRQIGSILNNFSQQANSNITKFSQNVEQAQEQQQQVYLQNLQAKAAAINSAAGSGVTGSTIDNLFRGYDRATAISNFINERNLRRLGMQYDENYEALRVNAINNIYDIQPQWADNKSSYLQNIGGIFKTVGSTFGGMG